MSRISRRFAAALFGGCLLFGSLAGAAAYKPPRTPSGAPDLQGIWDTETFTSLERGADFKTLVVPDAEANAYERRRNDLDQATAEFKKALPNAPDVGAIYSEWDDRYLRLMRVSGQARSSILIDPPNGKLPVRPDVRAVLRARRLQELRTFDGPEVRPLAEQCISIPGPPLVSGDLFQILQSPGHVTIVSEAGHEARIIRLGDRRHGPAQLQPWMGDSVGWWEGDTLVVETTHFNPGEAWWAYTSRTPISPKAKVTERFSRTGPGEILYRFTVEDPTNYTQPWSGVERFTRSDKPQYEYACHEGNYAMANILAGARKAERDGGVPEPLDGGDPPPAPKPAP